MAHLNLHALPASSQHCPTCCLFGPRLLGTYSNPNIEFTSRPDVSHLLQVLLQLQHTVALQFTTIEDATVGMWLAGLDIQRLNWRGVMWAAGWTCCFALVDRYATASASQLDHAAERQGANVRVIKLMLISDLDFQHCWSILRNLRTRSL